MHVHCIQRQSPQGCYGLSTDQAVVSVTDWTWGWTLQFLPVNETVIMTHRLTPPPNPPSANIDSTQDLWSRSHVSCMCRRMFDDWGSADSRPHIKKLQPRVSAQLNWYTSLLSKRRVYTPPEFCSGTIKCYWLSTLIRKHKCISLEGLTCHLKKRGLYINAIQHGFEYNMSATRNTAGLLWCMTQACL